MASRPASGREGSERAPERIIIIGAGPCGLACGRELAALGYEEWLIVEAGDQPGGLAASVVDPAGFTWDLGGHVVFSHYGEFDALLREVMGEDLVSHDRSSYIRFDGRWVPYPFQNNLRHLPPEVAAECLDGLEQAAGAEPGAPFSTWMRGVFGEGITQYFMEPYNVKVWATATHDMSSHWIAERVAVIDYARARQNYEAGRDDLSWGPNNRFVFPSTGGTGEIYRRVAEPLADRIRYRQRVVEVQPSRRRVRIDDGSSYDYDALVSTMPLDRFVGTLCDAPGDLRAAAAQLRHNSVYMVGVGLEQPLDDDKSWMYFPQDDVPFYRVTNFAKYAAANVPESDTRRFSAYMTETAHSPERPVPGADIGERAADGLRCAGVVAGDPEVASIHVEQIDYAYPVPTLRRDDALAVIQPWLMDRSIFSRGRFGAWRYETGNMDHATKMGIDVARRLLGVADEAVWQL